MKVGLEDKVIVVTGAASGIGAAIARQAAGADVGALLLSDRDGAGCRKLEAELSAGGVNVSSHVADLGDLDAPGQIIKAAIERFGRVDGLVNAAGLTDRASFVDATPAMWDALFAINTRAPFFLMQAAIADMLARKASGTIVNILSMHAHCGAPELAIYAATKAALATLTRNAAHAHMADQIRANGINLGWVATQSENRMQSDILGKGPNWEKDAAATQPLGRLVTAQETARLAVFQLSDASGPMTGTVTDFEQAVTGALG